MLKLLLLQEPRSLTRYKTNHFITNPRQQKPATNISTNWLQAELVRIK